METTREKLQLKTEFVRINNSFNLLLLLLLFGCCCCCSVHLLSSGTPAEAQRWRPQLAAGVVRLCVCVIRGRLEVSSTLKSPKSRQVRRQSRPSYRPSKLWNRPSTRYGRDATLVICQPLHTTWEPGGAVPAVPWSHLLAVVALSWTKIKTQLELQLQQQFELCLTKYHWVKFRFAHI